MHLLIRTFAMFVVVSGLAAAQISANTSAQVLARVSANGNKPGACLLPARSGGPGLECYSVDQNH
jgi:hypothetical protein